jgi:hypothetical protein
MVLRMRIAKSRGEDLDATEVDELLDSIALVLGLSTNEAFQPVISHIREQLIHGPQSGWESRQTSDS